MWSSNLTQWCRWKPDKFTFRWQTAIGGKLSCISTSHYTRWKYCSWNNRNLRLFKYIKKSHFIAFLWCDHCESCSARLSFEKRKLLSLSNASQSYQPALLRISHGYFPCLNTCLHIMCICYCMWYYSPSGLRYSILTHLLCSSISDLNQCKKNLKKQYLILDEQNRANVFILIIWRDY